LLALLAGFLGLDLLQEALARGLVEAERLHHLLEDRVGRHVAVLEVLEMRHDLRLDEAADHVAGHAVALVSLDHGDASEPAIMLGLRPRCQRRKSWGCLIAASSSIWAGSCAGRRCTRSRRSSRSRGSRPGS